MQKDIRDTDLYREVEALYTSLRRPGTGQISDAAELHVSPDGTRAIFAGSLMEALEGVPPTRLCEVSLTSGDLRVLTFGPNSDRLPKYSPDGRLVAFLSDRLEAGDFQLYLLDVATGAARPAPTLQGWVEYLHWSPDGTRILLGVAGHGADVAGTRGAVTSKQVKRDLPPWLPTVETGEETYRWRRAWSYELVSDTLRQISRADHNVWDAAWCGNDAIAAVTSSRPGEESWYTAGLEIIEVQTGRARRHYSFRDQLGCVAGSPSGAHVAIVEAVCSDRGLAAGGLQLIDPESDTVRRIDTHGVDVTTIEWCTDRRMVLAGYRDFETVLALYDVVSGSFNEIWRSHEISTAGSALVVACLGQSGDCVLIGEGFQRAPEIATIRAGRYDTVSSFDLGYAARMRNIEAIERVSWEAPDGLEIHGWLLRPQAALPRPMVMIVHGGPISNSRPTFLGRPRGVPIMILLDRGYAVFLPNPRGSSGRGQDFARRVVGDMGGADTHDCLSGVEHLMSRGIADPARLGVAGISYGGFMTSWLITQDPRFAAAVAVAPISNWVSEHLISNLPHFVASCLADRYDNPGGAYFQRSPIMHAHKAKTPTLNICGALDRCTPPAEATQFHNALRERGVESVLVTYPQEGHGVRRFPAAVDYAARFVAWFERHMPVN